MLLRRLLPGLKRPPAVSPQAAPITDTTVSVIVPTRNEAKRLSPCLAGLARQPLPLVEIIVVDSASTDGTDGLVLEAARRDARIRLEPDPPLPPGWVGKVWALQHGLSLAHGEWILGVDADTEPNDGMVGGVLQAARAGGYDLVSFAPRFAGQSAGERWLQPALLTSLVYRTGAPGTSDDPERLLANGQCFLVRRSLLLQHGGYEVARDSFADDVRLARHFARLGARCGFLDGRMLYRVRSYRSAGEMWREWGRSIDLADARHRQTILAYGMNGSPLPVENGAPLRVRVERQLGYKMPKYLRKIELVDSFKRFGMGRGGYWEDNGYDWFGGI